jgi:hypothetical protein
MCHSLVSLRTDFVSLYGSLGDHVMVVPLCLCMDLLEIMWRWFHCLCMDLFGDYVVVVPLCLCMDLFGDHMVVVPLCLCMDLLEIMWWWFHCVFVWISLEIMWWWFHCGSTSALYSACFYILWKFTERCFCDWFCDWFPPPSRQMQEYWLKIDQDHFPTSRPGGGGLGIFLFTTASRTALGLTQPPIKWVPGALSLGIKRPGREADHLHLVQR